MSYYQKKGKDPNREDVADAFEDGIAEGFSQCKRQFIEKVYKWLKNYAFVDDNKNVNLPTLLHDFLKDSRSF